MCTAPLGCGLHCLSGAVLCTAPLRLCSELPLWGCALHCPFGPVLCTASLRLWSSLPLGAVVFTDSLGLCYALPPWGTVLFSAPLGLCSSLPLLSHALHCSSGAVLCTAPPVLWALGHCVQHGPSGLCFVLPLWGCALHFPPGAMLCSAPLGLCSALPL